MPGRIDIHPAVQVFTFFFIRACNLQRMRYNSFGTQKRRVLTKKRKTLLKEEMNMKLVPLADRVVLKQVEAEEVTKGGIVLPGSAKEKPQTAEVLAVGPGGVDKDGNKVKMEVAVGNKVIYSKYAGTEVKLDGTEYIVVRQNDILAVVED